MNHTPEDIAQRLALGAIAIERRLETMADQYAATIVLSRWNPCRHDADKDHHRLDFLIDDCSASIYFTKQELIDCAVQHHARSVDIRLRHVLTALHETGMPREIPQVGTPGAPLRLH